MIPYQMNSVKSLCGKRAGSLLGVWLFAGLSGCGSLPQAKVTYYHAQSTASFKVVRSVICDANNRPLVANSVTPTVVHSANISSAHTLNLSKLRGPFSDSDLKFEWYDDRRLKSVNASTTGQGESILKAVATLVSTTVPFTATPPEPDYLAECTFIKNQGGGKPISLTYEGTISTDKAKVDVLQPIQPDLSSSFYASRLVSAIGEVCAVITQIDVPSIAPVLYEPSPDDTVLKVRQPGWAQVLVSKKSSNSCSQQAPLWEGRIMIAQLGTDYVIPMIKPTIFGKKLFAVSFTESGALNSLQYGNNTGTAQALGGVNSLLTIAQGETTAQKVAEEKAEADLVLQQQRRIQCRADPKNCK